DPDKKLNIFCWSEYVPQEIIDSFTKETGIKVSVESYASNEEMLAKLLAGGGTYDLIQPSEYVIEGLIKENLLIPIDHAAIPNLKNIAPEFANMSFDPGNKFSIPYMAGTVGIVVNTELVQDDIKSYNDVFQEKFSKNIVVLDDAREIVSWGFETLGVPINEVSDENLEKVKPVLSKWLPLVKVFDSDSPKTALLNGDVALGIVWGGEGAILLNENKKFKWVVPAEGAHLFVDSLAIPKTATHVKNAQLFMNYILRPDISVKISDAFPYLNPNAAARELLTPAQRSNGASYPTADELATMQTFKDIGEQASKIDELVTSLKAQ
ncbi:MAG: spermidine/putrescine ABC transporter substrate-binding protein, partial [Terrimicrobiaceae bacterium]